MKPIVVVSTPRTGSTMMFEMLERAGVPVPRFYEFFNFRLREDGEHFAPLLVDGAIAFEMTDKRWPGQLSKDEITFRIDLLRQSPKPYSFKVFPKNLDVDVQDREIERQIENSMLFKFLAENYQIVALRRRNRLAQCLSMLRVMDTGRHHYRIGMEEFRIPKRRHIRREEIADFFREIAYYEVMKAKLPTIAEIDHEDVSRSPSVLGSLFGVDITEAPSYIKPPPDFDWVANLSEVAEWVEEFEHGGPSAYF